MNDLLKPKGNTPFEIAEARAMAGAGLVRAAAHLEDLILKIDECDKQIAQWTRAVEEGDDSPEVDELRMLAIEAMKERMETNQQLDDMSAVMIALFNIEA